MKAPLALLLALTAFSQTQPPEIRGIVAELGTRAPLAGATVTLYKFAPNEDNLLVRKAIASAATGPDGTFSFKPGHLGRFMLSVAKDGYRESLNSDEPIFSIADLDAKNPVQSIRFGLTRPGALTGRVIDRDGNPVANVRVGLDEVRQPGAAFLPGAITAVTNAEGIFTRQNLTPGSYIVSITPQYRDEKGKSAGEELADFSEEEFKIIDEDFETSYWPGGVPSPKEVLPITVPAGGIANIGTIAVRKILYYRVHISYRGDCAANERWEFRVGVLDRGAITGTPHFSSCRKEGLLTHLAPGAYQLGLWSGRDIDRWGLASFTITDKNVEIPLDLNDAFDITGRVTTPSGGPDLKTLGPIQVTLSSSNRLPSSGNFSGIKDGQFTMKKMAWTSHWISARVSDPDVYVKEIRYNGLPLRTHELDAGPGGQLEVILDRGAASLSLTFKNGDAPTGGLAYLLPASISMLPALRSQFEPFTFIGFASGTVPIVLKNVPPGDYRLYAGADANRPNFIEADSDTFSTRFQQIPKLTLGRGEQKSIEVQLKP